MSTRQGVAPSPEDSRDWSIVRAGVCTDEELAAAAFPASFTLSDLPPVYCQWFRSTCVPHALATVKEYHTGRRQSTDFIYANRAETDSQREGMVTRQALGRLKSGGSVAYARMPGNHDYPTAKRLLENHSDRDGLFREAAAGRIQSYYRIHTLEELKMTLTRVGPAVITVHTYGFPRPVVEFFTGKLREGKRRTGGHAMTVIGWRDHPDGTALIVRNSFSRFWGNGGNGEVEYGGGIVKEMWGVVP